MASRLRMKSPPLIVGLVAILLLASPVFAGADPPPPPPTDSIEKTTIEVISKKSGAAVDKDDAREVLQKIAPPSAQRTPEAAVDFEDVCLDRFQSCTSYTVLVNQYRRLQDPVPVGTWIVNLDIIQITMWNQQTTTLGSNAKIVGSTGAAKNGTISLEFHSANYVNDDFPESWDSPDIIGTHTFTASLAMLNQSQSDQYEWFPGIADEWDEATTSNVIITGTFPGYVSDFPNVQTNDNWVRCDWSATGAATGCVNPANQAKLVTMKQLPNILANIRNQVANGAPTILTRLQYDLAHINANREAVCPASRPRPTGMSCDEYPFARSYEGGYANGVGGWAWVPTGENDLQGENDQQGGFISAFYQYQRVMDGEPYEVDIAE